MSEEIKIENPIQCESCLRLEESNDRYLRLSADFDNYKKRVQKEKEDFKISIKTSMISSILELDSDLSLAMKSRKDDEGLTLIMSKLEKFLNNHGIETIQTHTYDVDLHDVVSIVEIGESKIVDVVSKGYSIDGKVFRYPKIILGR